MKQKHLVSVVLPTYNGSKWLSQSIDSILKQTYRNLELIIVDDASTDSTPELIMSFASRDPRIRIISHKSNKKLPQSLNDGFAIANGDYFTWTSDDNWYEPTAIEEMVTALTNSKYDMVIADINHYQDKEFLKVYETNCSVDSLSRANTIGACFLYTREIAEKVGKYDTEKFLVEDYDYWLRILLSGNILHLNRVLYNYRYHSSSLTSTRLNDIKYADLLLKYEVYPMLKNMFEKKADLSEMAHYVGYITAVNDLIEKLKKNCIRVVNIYGSGFICFLLLDYLTKNNISVNHIFDSSPDIISSKRYGYTVEELFSTNLSENDVILVASDKYAEEISQRVNEYSIQRNTKLTVIIPGFSKW